jgi:hypothetical protein
VTWTPEERRIRDLMATNYGVAGPVFARWCVTHQAKVKEVVDKVTAHWNAVANATDDERFWTATCVSIISAFLLAGPKYANIIEVPTPPIVEFLMSLINRHRRVIAGNQKSAMDTLNAYTAEHIGQFVKTAGSFAIQPSSSRQSVKGRIEYNVTPGYVDYYIDQRLLKLHCADNSIGYDAFLKELEQAATVQIVRKNLLAGTKGPDLKAVCVKITRTVADVESDEL